MGWAIICTRIATFLGTVRAKLSLKMLGCTVGKNFRIDGRIYIWAQRKEAIYIGNNVKINSRFGSNLVGITNPTIFQCLDNGIISIGNNSGLSSVVLSSRSSITIGENAKIGGNVRIFDHNYHSLDFEKRRGTECAEDVKTSPVRIGDDVFVGTNAIILKGVTIGARSIIQAGAVVSRDVPSDEIWGGNPARYIRK